MNKGISIVIICIENEKIKTEKIYFQNKRYRKSYGNLREDKVFRQQLNLKNIFFLSLNILFAKIKVKYKICNLLTAQPIINKFFVICDRDYKSLTKEQIIKQVKKLEKIILSDFPKSKLIYLEYENDGNNFETFLSLHFKNRKLFKGYQKNQKDIYEKTMRMNGKNFNLLISNIKKYQQAIKFKQLFTKHKDVDWD